MQSRRGGLPARRGIHADRRVWNGDVSSGGEQRLKCSNTGLGYLDYKLPPRSIFFLFLNFLFFWQGEGIDFCLHFSWGQGYRTLPLRSFPWFSLLFARAVLPYPSHSAIPWWLASHVSSWQHYECFRIRTRSLFIFELHAYTEYIAGPLCINNS